MFKFGLVAALATAPQASEPSLSSLMEVMEPYLLCRTPFDREIIDLQQELNEKDLVAQHAGQEFDRYSDPLALKIRRIHFEGEDQCKLGDLVNIIYGLLPDDKGDQSFAATELINGAVQMRRIQLIFEEALFRLPPVFTAQEPLQSPEDDGD